MNADDALADIEMAAAVLASETSPAHAAAELRRTAAEIESLSTPQN